MGDLEKTDAPVHGSINNEVNEKIKQYNKAVRLAKLSSILLEKIAFKISPDAPSAKQADLKRELNVKTNILSYDPSSGDCVANIIWSIKMMKKRKRLVDCSASYIVLYDGIKECPEDAVQMFIDHVGKTATYAYFRALYAHLDWSANIGSPPLPVIQFQPKVGNAKPPESPSK
jgi:hypothetical protein